ncbi:MAG TPA: hypothetical protein VHT26_24570 [Trebonia sp.]|nr:hypothetical protein [Trebonia sp.]
MSTALWMNIPLMVLAFGLIAGIPLWLVLRRHDWHGKHETPSVPAYMTPYRTRRPVPVRVAMVRLPQPSGYEGRRSMRPLTGRANG